MYDDIGVNPREKVRHFLYVPCNKGIFLLTGNRKYDLSFYKGDASFGLIS